MISSISLSSRLLRTAATTTRVVTIRETRVYGCISPTITTIPSFLVLNQCRTVSQRPNRIDHILSVDPLSSEITRDRRTKIVCTVGPKTCSRESLKQLLYAGMNVMRLNCSHGNHKWFTDVINDLRYVVREVRKQHHVDFDDGSREDVCAVALDIKGPDIRTGAWIPEMKQGKFVAIGDQLILSPDIKYKDAQRDNIVFVNFAHLAKHLKPGNEVFMMDGLLRLVVDKVDTSSGEILCSATTTSVLGSRKSVNIPNIDVGLPNLKPQDIEDLKFAREIGADFVFASFVREAEHIKQIREIVGGDVHIVSKIESAKGIKNIIEIIDESDGIMVARGDLGVEIPLERVFLAQKNIVLNCKLRGKPVICATQMLESMVNSPIPTRAECGDVSNAVLEGVDAVMLSGETASGAYPIESVKIMSKICRTAEALIDYNFISSSIRDYNKRPFGIDEAVIASAVVAAYDSHAKAIIVITEHGRTARLAAKFRPSVPLICMTANPRTARQLQLLRGAQPILCPRGMPNEETITIAMKEIVGMGIAGDGDPVVVLQSQLPNTKTDVMKLVRIPTWIVNNDPDACISN